MDLEQSKPAKSKLCVTFCKIDFGLSNILYPTQSKTCVRSKVSDPAKNAMKPIFCCGSCENILKDKPSIYRLLCGLWYTWFHYKCVGIPREKKIDNAWPCSTCGKLDTTLKWYPNSNIEPAAYIYTL